MSNEERFIEYPIEPKIILEDRIKVYSEEDLNNLMREHAEIVAKRRSKEVKRFIYAIKEGNREIINEYVLNLSPRFAKEKIYNFNEFDYENIILTFGVTTGILAKAIQIEQIYKNQNPITVQGLVITKDNKIVFGIRGKPKLRKDLPDEPFDYKIMLCPAGYATFNKKIDLEKSFYKELEEEIGLIEDDVNEIILLGHHRDIGFTEGTKITFLTYINLPFKKVIERWKRASSAWEYEGLIPIENNRKTIIDLLNTNDFSEYSAKGLLEGPIRPVLKYFHSSSFTI